MTCPKCEAEMTDFRSQKASGAKPPKFPDFKCEACGHPVWAKAKPPVKTQGGPGMPAASPEGEALRAFAAKAAKWTWPTLSETYLQSLLIARKQVVGLATSLKLEVRMEDILSACATIFIAASRDGVKLIAQSREPEEETADV